MSKEKATESKGGEILLNLMFRGQYLQDNIGHEIINMFKADDDCNYIYVNPYGTFHKSHSGKIETILLGRYSGNNKIEIIAKAEELTEIVQVKEKETANIREKQKKSCAHICYNGVNIIDIFNANEGKNKNQLAWVSFKAEEYRRTRRDKKLFITDDETKMGSDAQNVFFIGDPDASNKIRFPKQSLKAYYAKGGKTDIAYNELNKIIHNKELWEEGNTTDFVKKNEAQDECSNFLKLIHKENDELSFSNLLKHYLSPRFGLMERFAKKILHLEGIEGKYTILREWKNIDILIEDEKQVIVIENKIKSRINGLAKDDHKKSQLGKYVGIAQDRANGKYEFKEEDKKINSQKNKKSKETRFYLFSPNYNHTDQKIYEGGEQYKRVFYSEIYKFFKENKPQTADRFYDDFVRALHKHTSNYPDDLYGEMLQKFAEAIQISTHADKFLQ